MQNNRFESTAQTTEADERFATTPTRRVFRRSTVTTFFGGAVVITGCALAIFAGPAGADGATTPTPVLPAPMCAAPVPGIDVSPTTCNDTIPTLHDPVDTQPTDRPIECPGTPAPGVPLPATAPR